MQATTLILLPATLAAAPLLAGWFLQGAHRHSPRGGGGGRARGRPKARRTQSKRTPPKKKPAERRPPEKEVHLSLEVPPGTKVRVTVGKAGRGEKKAAPDEVHDHVFEVPLEQEPRPSPGVPVAPGRALFPAMSAGRLHALGDSLKRRWQAFRAQVRHALGDHGFRRSLLGPTGWLALSLAVYLLVRLYHLEDYPIYFFTDEAVQTVLAADFVHAGFRDFLGHYFPAFFQNVYKFNLSLSVYAQVLPFLLFGKSVFVTRAAAVLLTVPGAAAIGLTLRDVFRARSPWVGVLLLSCAPAWFLHSRTAFETAMMASFYACFLYCYLIYRTRAPNYLYAALVFAAAVFYTYGPGEIIILGTGILLLASDARYHWQQRRVIARGLLVGLLLALPYVRFRLQLPEEHAQALRILDSVWVRDVPFSEKLSTSLGYYGAGLNPVYWFFTNTHDMGRHVMGKLPNLMTWTLPFVLGGIAISLRRIRLPEYRAILACMLAIPLGGAVAGTGITRLLSMVMPASLLAAIALDAVADWLARRVGPRLVAPVVFVGLSLVSLGLLRDALVHGPLWDRNYGMDIPWGAPQVFEAVKELIEKEPDTDVFVSPTWANGVDTLRRFFLPDDAPVDVANVDRYRQQRQELTDNVVLVLTAAEYEAVRKDPLFTEVRSERLIPYPDGSPGFYFVRMRYSAQADAIFEQERLERLVPITETLTVDGSTLTIEHPQFDSGGVQHLFDRDPYTLARGLEANPVVLKISFDTPRRLSGMDLTTGSMDIGLTVRLYAAGSSEPAVYSEEFTGLPNDPTVSLDFAEAPDPVSRVEIEILNLAQSGPTKIHLREIRFR